MIQLDAPETMKQGPKTDSSTRPNLKAKMTSKSAVMVFLDKGIQIYAAADNIDQFRRHKE
jgi:hypothetical protein